MLAVEPIDRRVVAAALLSAPAGSDSSVPSTLSTRRFSAAPYLCEPALRSVGQSDVFYWYNYGAGNTYKEPCTVILVSRNGNYYSSLRCTGTNLPASLTKIGDVNLQLGRVPFLPLFLIFSLHGGTGQLGSDRNISTTCETRKGVARYERKIKESDRRWRRL